jgi:transcriptional antiterminator NusG
VIDDPNNTIPQASQAASGDDGHSAQPAGQPEALPPVEAAPDVPAMGGSEPEPELPASEPVSEEPQPDTAPDATSEPIALTRVPSAEAAAPAKKAKRKSSKDLPEPEVPQEPKSENLRWYILKVQSNREDSIRDGLQRRVRIAGLDKYFGDIIVPTEMVTEFKGGKKRVVKRKLYPGYLVVHMEINEETWFLVRETPGIGDFTGAAGHPTPMLDHEIARIIARQEEKSEEAPKLKINFNTGDRVKINEGTFENFEGEVESIDQTNGRVTVMINIFGRSTPVELEYWQIESV